jgi:hypothetical protein
LISGKYIGENDYIISIIENGYKVPFKHTPENTFLDNNKSAKDNMTFGFVSKEVEYLLQKGCISTSKIQATCCKSFNSSLQQVE